MYCRLKAIKYKIKLAVRVKGTGHYWYLLKIIVSITTDFATSNGELLIV